MYLVSLVLSFILFVPAILMAIYKGKVNDYFARLATARDAYYNTVCGELFNAFFIQKGGYRFGKRKETISSALGKNKAMGKLTWLGNAMERFLSWIDTNHCLKNIDRTV